jgi:hypothetical protein
MAVSWLKIFVFIWGISNFVPTSFLGLNAEKNSVKTIPLIIDLIKFSAGNFIFGLENAN